MLKKSFLADERNFFRTADAFRSRRREGPHRFAQKRPRIFVSALQSLAAVETSKNRLPRDFRSRSISDFCNSIVTKRTSQIGVALHESVNGDGTVVSYLNNVRGTIMKLRQWH